MLTRKIVVGVLVALGANALADTGTGSDIRLNVPSISDTTSVAANSKAVADGNILSFPVPKVGFRIGGGEWNEFMVDVGMDVTFNVPFIPLPALRVDGEVWGKPGDFGQDRRGNALSILGVQTFIAGYAGIGPSYYFTDDQGSHHSGFGLKVLGGLSLPHSVYAEAGMILGPSTPPIFFTIGQRF